MNIGKISNIQTREEFLKNSKGNCPSAYGLSNNLCDDFQDCEDCRRDAIKDITFKGEKILDQREFKTGDIIYHERHLSRKSFGIVCGNKIAYISSNGWDELDVIKKDIIKFIPIEKLENTYLGGSILSTLVTEGVNDDLEKYFVYIKSPKQVKTICTVNFSAESDNPKEYLLETNDDIQEGEIIEVKSGANTAYQYARVKSIVRKELTKEDIDKYKPCRKLSTIK
jgi:hypothetical protein